MTEETKDHGASLLRADPSAAVTTETLPTCGDCRTLSHCEHWGRCLSECLPIDLAPMHCHHCAKVAERNQWLERVYAKELERQTVMTQRVIASARKAIHDEEFGSGTPSPSAERAPAPGRSAAPK